MERKMLLLGILGILLLGCTGQGGTAQPKATGQPQESFGDDVVLLLSDISGTVNHYEHESGGKRVKYFAVEGSDGEVRTAFDACEVCYNAGKGYSQAGDSVMCNNCGLKFRIDDLGTKNKGAGCWPAYLPHEIKGDYVVIRKADLEQGARFFS